MLVAAAVKGHREAPSATEQRWCSTESESPDLAKASGHPRASSRPARASSVQRPPTTPRRSPLRDPLLCDATRLPLCATLPVTPPHPAKSCEFQPFLSGYLTQTAISAILYCESRRSRCSCPRAAPGCSSAAASFRHCSLLKRALSLFWSPSAHGCPLGFRAHSLAEEGGATCLERLTIWIAR